MYRIFEFKNQTNYKQYKFIQNNINSFEISHTKKMTKRCFDGNVPFMDKTNFEIPSTSKESEEIKKYRGTNKCWVEVKVIDNEEEVNEIRNSQ